ncbi:MAG: hypothetical protein E6I12_15590 [Chloroflexi bacterium]|nr:MAG: hypothetical protein E6I12_15590 [Chloroflexota bacterium]TMF92694.1 MAG: hypothetical protein E6I05_09125 [Chloroflexota bacterium]TMG47253.1 MAG: hypothetical protein E6H85_00410 [Chloroflexota bacterium]
MLTGIRRHLGEWISITAHAERTPPRLTLTMTLGELPEGWPRSGLHARTWTGIIGLVLITPFIALLLGTVLRGAGHGEVYGWISASPAAIIAATVSLFIGIPVAIAMNLWRITRVGLRRHANALDGLFALEFAPLHLVVVLAALAIGGAFVGHLAADSYACLHGVRSAC